MFSKCLKFFCSSKDCKYLNNKEKCLRKFKTDMEAVRGTVREMSARGFFSTWKTLPRKPHQHFGQKSEKWSFPQNTS